MSLFGEQFAEMLATRFGRGILRSLAALQAEVWYSGSWTQSGS